MDEQTVPARTRLDQVEAGLDAIEATLARLDAGEVDGEVADAVPDDDPAEPDTSW